jgi:predicted DNA-binding ribbon-helix-helix protein
MSWMSAKNKVDHSAVTTRLESDLFATAKQMAAEDRISVAAVVRRATERDARRRRQDQQRKVA